MADNESDMATAIDMGGVNEENVQETFKDTEVVTAQSDNEATDAEEVKLQDLDGGSGGASVQIGSASPSAKATAAQATVAPTVAATTSSRNSNVKQYGQDPNVPDLSKYADVASISKSNARPEITKDTVDLMNSRFEKLVNKYDWVYSTNPIVLNFWRLYYIITGLLVVVLLTIPLALFIGLMMFIAFIVYIFTCRGACFGRFDSYMSFWRTFIGKQRISLCLTPMDKRGIFWHGWNRVILFYQHYEGIFIVAGEGTPFPTSKIYENLFGPVFPLFEGIAVSDNYAHSMEEVNSLTSQRDGYGVGVEYGEDIQTYCLPHTLSSTDARHRISREITFMAVDISDVTKEKESSENVNLVHDIYIKLSQKSKDVKSINEAYYPGILWYYICGGKPLDGDDLAFVLSNLSALAVTNPRFTFFLFGNNALLRQLYKGCVEYGKLFERLCPEKWAKIKAYCEKIGLKTEYGALIVGINVMFAGGRGAGRKIRRMITNAENDDTEEQMFMYWDTIEQDIKNGTCNFFMESLRQRYGIFPTYNLTQKDTKLTIKGKEYNFPAKTYVSLMQPLLNSYNTKYWNEPETWIPNRNYDKTILFNVPEMYCPYVNGEKRKNRVTGEEYNVHDISMRYCPGRMIALKAFKHMSENLLTEARKEFEMGANEMFCENPPLSVKLRQLFVPLSFMNDQISDTDSQLIILVRPEAFRVVFYCGFFLMLAVGIVLTKLGAHFNWNTFSETDNPIYETFGANNICIYFDNPPFTYISAAFWVLLLTQVLFYQITDFFRVHDAYTDGNITKSFYHYYKTTTICETIVFIYFTQSLAVKPRNTYPDPPEGENTIMHTMPYVFLIYAFFFVALKRFLYFHHVGLTQNYTIKVKIMGYLYIILLGLSAIVKSAIILPNLFGAAMWERPGLKWTKPLTEVNEPLFSFLVLICPFLVYWVINARLETITITVNRCHVGIRSLAELKKWLWYNKHTMMEKYGMGSKEEIKRSNDSMLESPMKIVDPPENVAKDELTALVNDAVKNKAARQELLEKYNFLTEKDSYRVFTPESFDKSNNNIIKLFEKNEKGKVSARLWRTIVALLIPLLLFPFMIALEQSVIQMLGIGLLLMFIAYFLHIFSIFGHVASKPRNIANLYRMYSVSSIAPGWTNMSVAYRIYAFEKHPIASISEFSAIDGGIAQTMLLTISCYSWAVTLCGMAFEVEDKIEDSNQPFHDAINLADIAEVVGCFGLVLIGTFDLDPFNPRLKQAHYTGAALGVGTLLGFFWQQYVIGYWTDTVVVRLIFPSIVCVIATIAFILWQYYGFVADTYPPQTEGVKDPKKAGCISGFCYRLVPQPPDLTQVTRISMKNVISEAIFLFCGALSMCLWLVFYHECHKDDYNNCRLP